MYPQYAFLLPYLLAGLITFVALVRIGVFGLALALLQGMLLISLLDPAFPNLWRFPCALVAIYAALHLWALIHLAVYRYVVREPPR